MNTHDAVVIGGGASGLAAAQWIARYRRDVLVLDSGDYRAASVDRSHGYLGRDPGKPHELLSKGREELRQYPTASYQSAEVTRLDGAKGRFRVELGDGTTVGAHRLVLATGVADVVPDIDGFAEHYGAGVFHCPSCDGYEAKDRHVVAIGWDPHLVGFAGTLLNWAASVTVVTDGREFRGDDSCEVILERHGIELLRETATRFVGSRGDLQGVELSDGRLVQASLAFFSLAHVPRTDLATSLGCQLDEDGYVVIDEKGETTVPGVYAAGDLVPGLQLIQIAAAKGTVAGVALAHSLFCEQGSDGSPEPAPDVDQELQAAANG